MKLGKQGENRACLFLERSGYEIFKRNYRTVHGEIDIIAWDNGTLVFVEVKTRRSTTHGIPEEAVDERKRSRLRSIADAFISHYQLFGYDCRFDVIAIRDEGSAIRLKHMKNAFY